jgi:hypothetical protein
MSRIIMDFIKCSKLSYGVGFFENDKLAVIYANSMGANQRKKYLKYRIVPSAFFSYLKSKRAIRKNDKVPSKSRTVQSLLDLLWNARDISDGAYSEGETIREALLIEMYPELRRGMGSSQQLWHAIERNGQLYGLKRS